MAPFSSIFTNFRLSSILNLLLRTMQLIDGLVVIGLYGIDLNHAHKQDKYTDGKWVRIAPSSHSEGSIAPEFARLIFIVQVYAVVVGSLAAFTAIVYGVVSVFLHYRSVTLYFLWEWVLVILWAALSGIFGTMYMGEKVEMDQGIHRMKVAVGFDLAGMVLWFASAVLGTLWFFRERWAGKVGRRRGKA